MSARIGDIALSNKLTNTMLTTQSRVRETQVQVSTGKTSDRYTDIARDSDLLVRTEHLLARSETFEEQNSRILDRMRAIDGSLNTIVDTAVEMRTLLVQALDGASNIFIPMEGEADAALESISTALNLKIDDRYLFAGSRTDTVPVDLPATPITVADPTLYYQGDDISLKVRADIDVEIDYTVRANDPAFAELIAGIGEAADAHQANDRGRLQAAYDRISQALDDVIDLRGGHATRTKRLESVNEIHESAQIYMKETISRLEDVDIAEAMSRLAQDKTNLEATYVVIGQLADLTLANYIR
ncbi:MAG: flagellin [Geminicoccaceae bacterium]